MSAWLFDNMIPGRTVNFRGVDGSFTLQRIPTAIPPAGLLLIAGGIGITPMRVMFHDSIKKGIPVTLLHSIREPSEAIFHQEFRKVCKLFLEELFLIWMPGTYAKQNLLAELEEARIVSSSKVVIPNVCPL